MREKREKWRYGRGMGKRVPDMVNPERWKAIADYSGKAWSAVGPLVGILIGARLARSSERKHWLADNRKTECRELLTSISHAATLTLNIGKGTSRQEAYEAYLNSVRMFKDRIFIAVEVDDQKILDTWAYGVHDYGDAKITEREFSDRIEKVREAIINIALRDVGQNLPRSDKTSK
jgi:hypothetical protein